MSILFIAENAEVLAHSSPLSSSYPHSTLFTDKMSLKIILYPCLPPSVTPKRCFSLLNQVTCVLDAIYVIFVNDKD